MSEPHREELPTVAVIGSTSLVVGGRPEVGPFIGRGVRPAIEALTFIRGGTGVAIDIDRWAAVVEALVSTAVAARITEFELVFRQAKHRIHLKFELLTFPAGPALGEPDAPG